MYLIIALAIIVFSVMAVTERRILRAATYLLFTQQATRRFFHHQTDIPSIFCQFTIGELSYFCHDPSPNHVVNEKPQSAAEIRSLLQQPSMR